MIRLRPIALAFCVASCSAGVDMGNMGGGSAQGGGAGATGGGGASVGGGASTGGGTATGGGGAATGGGTATGGGAAGGGSAGGAGGGTAGGSGGGGTAGGSGGGAADAGFYGASRCSSAGVRFCEDFESGTFDPNRWTQLTHGGTLAIDTTHAARGSMAMHATVVDAAGNEARLRNTSEFVPSNYPGKTYFGRVFAYVTPAASVTHNGFIDTAGTLPNPDGGTDMLSSNYGVDMVNQSFVSHFGLKEGATVLFDTGARSTTPIPIAAWHCWEWKWDGQNNEEHFWLDENEVTDAAVLSNKNWFAPQPFTALELGLKLYHTEDAGFAAYDVWFDEFALDDARIGCSR